MINKLSRVNIESLKPLEKFIGSDENPKFFFTMTEINKIGINPKSTYSTPLGIYCYPLTRDYYNKLVNNDLPFVKEKPYIGVFTLNVSTFNMKNYSEANLEADKNTIKTMYGIAERDCLNAFEDSKFDTPISKLWNLTRLTARENPLKWSSILRSLGYTNFYDPGTGLIHNNEPTQAVILDTSIILPIETFLNPYSDIRGFQSGVPEGMYKHVPEEDIAALTSRSQPEIEKILNLSEQQQFDIVMSSSMNLYIKEMLIEQKITNPEFLKRIVLNNNLSAPLRGTAALKIKDQEILKDLFEDTSIVDNDYGTVRQGIIANIKDADILKNIALDTSIDPLVRFNALSSKNVKIDDREDVLASILQGKLSKYDIDFIYGQLEEDFYTDFINPKILVEKLPKELLFKLILTDKKYSLARYITDIDLLYELIKDSKSLLSTYDMFIIIDKIKDEELLYKLFLKAREDKKEDLMEEVVKDISAWQYLIEILAMQDVSYVIKNNAVKRIRDSELLQEIAKDTSMPASVRSSAIWRTDLYDTDFFAQFVKDPNPLFRKAVASRSADENLLLILADDKDVEVRRSLAYNAACTMKVLEKLKDDTDGIVVSIANDKIRTLLRRTQQKPSYYWGKDAADSELDKLIKKASTFYNLTTQQRK